MTQRHRFETGGVSSIKIKKNKPLAFKINLNEAKAIKDSLKPGDPVRFCNYTQPVISMKTTYVAKSRVEGWAIFRIDNYEYPNGNLGDIFTGKTIIESTIDCTTITSFPSLILDVNDDLPSIPKLDYDHFCDHEAMLTSDPCRWNPGTDTLENGIKVFVTSTEKLYILNDVDYWRSKEAWQEVMYDKVQYENRHNISIENHRLEELDKLISDGDI